MMRVYSPIQYNYQKAQAGTLFPKWTETIGSVNVPLLIVGDSAYPSLPWLIKAYPEHPSMSAAQKISIIYSLVLAW